MSKSRRQAPPKWADKLLEWYCNPELLEDLQGDLYELYHSSNAKYPKLQYIWWILRSMRWSTLNRKRKIFIPMQLLKSNFRISFRILLKNKVNTALNILGLSIGLTCFLLVGMYLKQELSFDSFHEKSNRIYRMWGKEDYGEGKVFFNTITPLLFENLAENNFPQVERAVQHISLNGMVGEKNQQISEPIAMISPDFHRVFDIGLLSLSDGEILPDKNSVIITESIKQKYFGEKEAMGKTLLIQLKDEIQEFTVTAIRKDPPQNTGFVFPIAVSSELNAYMFGQRALDAWFNVIAENYILLKESANISELESGIQDIVNTNLGDRMQDGVFLVGFQPLPSIHLDDNFPAGNIPVSNPDYVFILGITAFIILLLACLNYTSIAIGQSLVRGNEVAIRKVLGAKPKSLVMQHLTESFLITLLSILIALLISRVALPAFNRLIGSELIWKLETDRLLILGILLFMISLLAGFYPGILFSRFNILKTLKGSNPRQSRLNIRQFLLGFQLFVAISLVSVTMITRSQLKYLQNHDTGFKKESTLSLALRPERVEEGGALAMIEQTIRKNQVLADNLKLIPEIKSVGMGTHVPGTPGWLQASYNDDRDIFRRFRLLSVEPGYLETLDLKFDQGRNFDIESTADKNLGIILNQSAVSYFDLKDPIGKQLPGNDFDQHEIIGVVEDFTFSSLHNEVEPLIITQNPLAILKGISDTGMGDTFVPKMIIRFAPTSLPDLVADIKSQWKELYPESEFNYTFLSQQYRQLYDKEAQLDAMLTASAIISLIIAFLGILGLSMIVINHQKKQIGIRQIVGAGPGHIFKWLLRKFTWPYLIASILAIPVILWSADLWLQNFAFRIKLNPAFILLGIAVVFFIGIVIIFLYARKAFLVQPVKTLKSE